VIAPKDNILWTRRGVGDWGSRVQISALRPTPPQSLALRRTGLVTVVAVSFEMMR